MAPVRTLPIPPITDEAWRVGAARAKLLGWCRYVDPAYRWPRHIRLLADYLEAVERGEVNRLIVEVPPRHGKSELCSVRFPAWLLGRDPDRRVILAAHTASLAYTFSRRCRNEFAEHSERVWGVHVADDSSAVDAWDIAGRKGGLVAAGVGGPITGQGADLLVIDDPVKDAEAANSPTQREAVWEWWTHVARTRLHPGAAVVLVATRWHGDDLTGRILRQGGEEWEVLRLPALAEEGDPLGREPGEALWPERYPTEELNRIRLAVGPRAWAALYQQRPLQEQGTVWREEMIDRNRVVKPPTLRRIVVGVDPEAESGEGSAETGIVAAGLGEDGHAYVLEDASLRGTPDAWARQAVAVYHRHEADCIVAEANQGGEMVRHTLHTVDPRVRVKLVRASKGKVARAEPVAALYEQRRVHHVGTFPALEEQMVGWVPGARSPDRLDALVWALTELMLTTRTVTITRARVV